ncbi:MAG: NUDIX domain-containing protein [archaeon]
MKLSKQKGNHFTSTVFIVEDEKVLLLKHKRLNVWLPPGGHVEPNELPQDTAFRETLEEIGHEIEFITTNKEFKEHHNFLKENDNRTTIIASPWQVLLEDIEENHKHIDLLYIARPGKKVGEGEKMERKWFSKQELENLNETFPNVKYFGLKAIEKVGLK